MIKILAGGKKSTPWLTTAIEEYTKRLHQPFDCSWQFCDESKLLDKIKRLPHDEFLILLDETGTILDSPSLSKTLADPILRGQGITILIGGAFGHFDPQIKQRANLIWSLSRLVFPHQICRLLVAEQIYRSQEIYLGHPYHHA